MKLELIYIGKKSMICLHTFEDDIYIWKRLLRCCGSLGSDDLKINNNIYKNRRLIFPHIPWLDSHLFVDPVVVLLRRYG